MEFRNHSSMGGFRRGFPKIKFRNKSFRGISEGFPHNLMPKLVHFVSQKSDWEVFLKYQILTISESGCFHFGGILRKIPIWKFFGIPKEIKFWSVTFYMRIQRFFPRFLVTIRRYRNSELQIFSSWAGGGGGLGVRISQFPKNRGIYSYACLTDRQYSGYFGLKNKTFVK